MRKALLYLFSAAVMMSCAGESENLALYRAARHSSSFDMNQTAQLVTDGIVTAETAPWVNLSIDGQEVPMPQRNYLVDFNVSGFRFEEGSICAELELHGIPLDADKVLVAGNIYTGKASEAVVEVSYDGQEWVEAGKAKGSKAPTNDLIIYKNQWEVPLQMAPNPAAIRLKLSIPGGSGSVNELFFYKGERLLEVMPNTKFVSFWKSAGSTDEWLEVDLGAVCKLEKARFVWINPTTSGRIMVSKDGKSWKEAAKIGGGYDVPLNGARGRYVRAEFDSTKDGEPFELSEWEIIGKKKASTPGAAAGRAAKAAAADGISWKLTRATDDLTGGQISSPGFDDSAWLPAVVPGTVLGSYVAAGAVHEPNFAANQLYISDSYFRSDFWYRGTLEADIDTPRQFLNFDGVNYQADIYLNGTRVGHIGSAFDAASFDVTGVLFRGTNHLAVKIIHNPHYGAAKLQTAYTPDGNGGVLGADNPTMHASIGWDWIPTVRGRNIGIYDKVYVTGKGDVTIQDPFVRTELPLPDTTRATLFASATLCNHNDAPITGILEASFGELKLSQELTLEPLSNADVAFEPALLENPRLWWPNGYGEQNLYPVEFRFKVDDAVSDQVNFLSGVRQMDYRLEPYKPVSGNVFEEKNTNQRLSIYINGRRFIGFGGNWGFSEHLMRYTEREYDIAVRNHALMNFTMIRDWVGMIDNKAFYEACDRYGIMIWQDFWLANPWDGPNPANPEQFNEVATRYVRRIRNHPSIALYVGRNEGYPPEEIDSHIRKMLPKEHPGLFYIPHSAADGVTGGGPYRALPVKEYYQLHGHDKMHSERGMPAVMNYENMVRAFGQENVEPYNSLEHPNEMYGIHDYTLGVLANSAQSADSFNKLLETALGVPADAREFAYLAQWINYDGYRAMFESRSEYRRGLILWMSHPAWPSMVWQTYDYYFEPTGAFFGSKKACEPLHIQLNALKGTVEVVNYHAGARAGLIAEATVLDMYGNAAWSSSCPLDIAEDETVTCFQLEVPADITPAYFVKLKLKGADNDALLSENFYWQGREEGNVQALRKLEKTTVEKTVKQLSPTSFSVTLTNTGSTPALMIRLKLKDSATGDLALPVWYSDNYFFLMPGESRSIDIQVESLKGKAIFETEGMNL